MRTDGTAVAVARLEALRRAAPPSGWVPGPALLDPPPGAAAAPDAAALDEPEPERFWSGVDAPGPPPGRALLSRRAAVAVLVVVAAVLAGVAVRIGLPSGEVTDAPPPAAPAARTSGTLAAPAVLPSVSPAPAPVVVHVAGRVRRGGLVTLPAGSRVAEAVRAAGGARPDADLGGLNLARRLVDGEQVVVPGPGQVVPAQPATAAASRAGAGAEGGVVDLNAATEDQFDALPGIGPVIAGRIVAWRQEHGRFTSVDELAEVQGIGDKLLARLREQVRV
jgi:competence protein ComEA